MLQKSAHQVPLCKIGLVANSILFFCIDNSDTLKDSLSAYNLWIRERGKAFNLSGKETALALSYFDNFIFFVTPQQRQILKDIELRYMTPQEVDICTGKI